MRTMSWKKWAIGILSILLAISVVFGVRAISASAEEEFTPDITVDSAKALKEAVLFKATAGENYKIRLDADIVLGTEDDYVVVGEKDDTSNKESDDEHYGLRIRNKDITIDLNGHTMKRQGGGFVINNQIGGKLELIDTSADKTGLITNDEANEVLIYNWGTLIINVNMTIKTRYFNPEHSSFNSYALIQSSASPSEKDMADDAYKTLWANKPSVTIKGGKFEGGKSNEFFKLIDSALTIEDGTFTRDEDNYLTRSIFTANTYVWQFKDVNSNYQFFTTEAKPTLRQEIKTKKGTYLDAYMPYRGCTVNITGGNFIGSQGRVENITLNNEIMCSIPCGSSTYYGDLDMEETINTHKVTISGGTWATDYTTYCAPGMWMQLADEVGDYYTVKSIDEDSVVATVTAADVEKKFSSLNAAWLYATRNLDGERTVKANQDTTISQLNLWYGNDDTDALPGTVTLDLNGKKITYNDKDSTAVNGSKAAIALGNDGNLGADKTFKLIVKDSTTKQDGELIFNIASVGGDVSEPTSNRGIHISNQYASFELQSGTIRQTGYFPDEDTYKDLENGNSSQKEALAIFYIGASLKNTEGAIVTIKGGNILSEVYYGTEANYGDLTSSPVLVAWGTAYATSGYKNVNFQEGGTQSGYFPNKKDRFKFDLHTYVVDEGHTSVFSWDLKDKENEFWGDVGNEFNDLTYVTMGTNRFAFTHLEQDDNFLAGGARYKDLTTAIAAAKEADGVVSLLRDTTIEEALTLEDVALDLDAYLGCHIKFGESGTLTLKDGAVLRNGTLEGPITIEGNATLQGVTVEGNVTVTSGTLTILSGQFGKSESGGEFDIREGASLEIHGGRFKGSQVETLDEYFATTLGAYTEVGQEYDDATLYEVKVAPNLAARQWYQDNQSKPEFEITSTDEWNYFAIYVSSGVFNFKGKTVKLTAEELDFGYRPENASIALAAYGQENEKKDFFPVGNQTNKFEGTFDGGQHTIKGVHVIEINAGLFGGTGGSAKISNITVTDSKFEGGSGVGYFDEFNIEKGWVFVGGVIAQGTHANNDASPAENIKVKNVTLSQKDTNKNIMGGGYIGQTWSNLHLKNIEVDGLTLEGSWKMGGIVGFTEASVTVENGSVKNLDTSKCGTYVGAVMGQLVGQSLTLDSCEVEASGDYLIGGADAGTVDKKIEIKGAGTDIEAKGTANLKKNPLYAEHELTPEVTVPTAEEETQGGFSVNFGEEELPADSYVLNGETVVVRATDGNEVTKDKSALVAGDKIIAGKSAKAFAEDYIANGYCFILNGATGEYEIKEISAYNEVLLKELAAGKDALITKATYSAEAQAALEKLYTDAEAQLAADPELSMQGARWIVSGIQWAMNSVPTLAEEQAQEEAEAQAKLAQDIKDAKSELQLYAASQGVDLTDPSVTDGLEDIDGADAATLAETLESAKNAVKAVADQAKADAEQAQQAAALAKAREDAQNELQLYAASKGVSLEDDSVKNGLTAIGSADAASVESELTKAKAAVDAVKTALDAAAAQAAQQAEQQAAAAAAAAALAQAKASAQNELQLYAVSKGVSLDDASVKEGLDGIDGAASADEIKTKLETAKQGISAVQLPEPASEDGGVIALVVIISIETVIAAGVLVALCLAMTKKKKTR